MNRKLVGPWNSASPGPAAPETTVDELVANLASRPVQVVDVRELDEWVTGVIPGSILMPMDEVRSHHHEPDKSIPIVTVCHSGVRSLFSAAELLAAGFTDVRSLAGGMVAWFAAGQSVEDDRVME